MNAPQDADGYAGYRVAPYPDVIAHDHGPDPLTGHGQALRCALAGGEDASAYFERAGIAALADRSDGLCTFWLDDTLAIYQNSNRPLVQDSDLAPSINTNASLFGSFVGGLAFDDVARKPKRDIVERVLGNSKFIDELEDAIIAASRAYLMMAKGVIHPLDDFTLKLSAYVDSMIPGVLDLSVKPLNVYLASSDFGGVARSFFEIASQVISKLNPQAIQDAELIVDFTRAVLIDNYEALAVAPPSNIIRAQFDQFGLPFSLESIQQLGANELKELGTIIVATYDTTALSLLWTIAYLETTPAELARFRAALDHDARAKEVATLLVLEALRLGGSNPTALWRQVLHTTMICHRGVAIEIAAGTMLWLDRRRANRDPCVFANPTHFDTANIECIKRRATESTASLLARNRYEINSFSMINTERNPRKCPARIFSIRAQVLMLIELYRAYRVNVTDVDISLAAHSAMPRPNKSGNILFESGS
jgi:hypothetical protein